MNDLHKPTPPVTRDARPGRPKVRSAITSRRAFLALGLTLALLSPVASSMIQDSFGMPGVAYAAGTVSNCRFGITTPTGLAGGAAGYDLNALGVAAYLDWGLRSNPEGFPGIEYVQVVRLRDSQRRFILDTAAAESWAGLQASIQAVAAARPGSAWLVGNEPDTTYENQDGLTPDEYAQAYHAIYPVIRAADPMARIGIGTIVQPTPLRLQWLDLMWSAYQARYGTTPPSDFWSIHSFILREERGGWGTGIPPGAEFAGVNQGVLYEPEQTDRIDFFQQRIVDFRNWMAGKGERGKPLWVTEYGSLMPHDPSHGYYTFPITRTRDYMLATFNYLMSATDAGTGLPLDGNRLVQRWFWYSLNDYQWKMGGGLFDPERGGARTILGDAFAAYVNDPSRTPSIDLSLSGVSIDPAFSAGSNGVAYTVTGTLRNTGDTAAPAGTRLVAYEIADDWTIREAANLTYSVPVPGCAESRGISLSWTSAGSPRAVQVSVELPAGYTDANALDNFWAVPVTAFADVPYTHPNYRYIEALFQAGLTAGCQAPGQPRIYCPDRTMTRAESAVFILVGHNGAGYLPPNPGSQRFSDVVLNTWYAKWTETLYQQGFTAGCQARIGDPLIYCPNSGNKRVEGSVFYLRIKHGRTWAPPVPAGSVFSDVTDPTWWGTKWAEAAYQEELIPACDTSGALPRFCSDDLMTRSLAAYMMVRAKDLPLP